MHAILLRSPLGRRRVVPPLLALLVGVVFAWAPPAQLAADELGGKSVTGNGLGGDVLDALRTLDATAHALADDWVEAEKDSVRAVLVKKMKLLRNRQDQIVDQAFEAARKDGSVTFTEASLAAQLVEWSRLQGPAYTLWGRPAKTSSKRCPDPVRDQLLFDAADHVVDDDPAAYVATLGRLVQGLECFSMRDARRFADQLGRSIRKAINRIDPKRQRSVRRVLLASHANALLVVHDLTKAFGPTALSRLLTDERRALGEVFAMPSSPQRLTGLWLYHPSLDRLVQLDPLCEARRHEDGASCISASAILDAATRADRLAFGNCHLAEMITPVFDERVGYRCQRHVCEKAETTDVAALSAMFQDGTTPHGQPVDTLQKALCPDGLGGRGTAGVLGRLDDLVGCITETLLSERSQAETQCVADLVQRARSPWITAPPDRHETCGNPLAQDGPDLDPFSLALGNILDRHQDGCTAGVDACVKRAALALFDYTLLYIDFSPDEAGFQAVGEILDAIRNAELTDDVIRTEIRGRPIVLQRTLGTGFRQTAADLLNLAMGLLEMLVPEDEPADADPPTDDPNPPESPADEDDDTKYCLPDLGDCGDCSPGEAMRRALLACSFDATPSPERGLVDPRVVEPVPWDDPNAAAWVACLEAASQREAEEARASMACAHLQCRDGEPRVVEGRCVCDGEATNRLPRDDCAFTRCPEDNHPVATPAGCRCQGPLTDGPGVPPSDGPLRGTIYDRR